MTKHSATTARGGTSTVPGRPELMGPGLGEGTGLTEPKPIPADIIASMTAQAAVEMAPTLIPAGVDAKLEAAAAAALTGTWRQNVQVTAMWSINENRNAWMHVANIGWKKLFNGRDGSFNALVTLASQAKQTGKAVSYREENDGMVYEIYLW
jgi:hypothetical protein